MRNAGGKTFTICWAHFMMRNAESHAIGRTVLMVGPARWHLATRDHPNFDVNSPTVGFLTCQRRSSEIHSIPERWGVAQMMMCWVRLISVNFVGLIDLEVPKKGGTYIFLQYIYIYTVLVYMYYFIQARLKGCCLKPKRLLGVNPTTIHVEPPWRVSRFNMYIYMYSYYNRIIEKSILVQAGRYSHGFFFINPNVLGT